MKLVIKGIVTSEDAHLFVEHEVDGIFVSNHGGRTKESGFSMIESLLEVVKVVKEKIAVLIDGEFRRGTDRFKLLHSAMELFVLDVLIYGGYLCIWSRRS